MSWASQKMHLPRWEAHGVVNWIVVKARRKEAPSVRELIAPSGKSLPASLGNGPSRGKFSRKAKADPDRWRSV